MTRAVRGARIWRGSCGAPYQTAKDIKATQHLNREFARYAQARRKRNYAACGMKMPQQKKGAARLNSTQLHSYATTTQLYTTTAAPTYATGRGELPVANYINTKMALS